MRLSLVSRISLTAKPAHTDPEAVAKQLFSRVKRRVLAVLKVHHGKDLEAVFAQEVTEEDEDLWGQIIDEEEQEELHQAQLQGRAVVPPVDNIRKCVCSLSPLPRGKTGSPCAPAACRSTSSSWPPWSTLSTCARRASCRVAASPRPSSTASRATSAPSVRPSRTHPVSRCWVKGLTRWRRSLADHRRVQREQELHTMHATLASLRDNMRYLGDQITSYHVYIDQSMAGIQKKRCAQQTQCLLPATRGALS